MRPPFHEELLRLRDWTGLLVPNCLDSLTRSEVGRSAREGGVSRGILVP